MQIVPVVEGRPRDCEDSDVRRLLRAYKSIHPRLEQREWRASDSRETSRRAVSEGRSLSLSRISLSRSLASLSLSLSLKADSLSVGGEWPTRSIGGVGEHTNAGEQGAGDTYLERARARACLTRRISSKERRAFKRSIERERERESSVSSERVNRRAAFRSDARRACTSAAIAPFCCETEAASSSAAQCEICLSPACEVELCSMRTCGDRACAHAFCDECWRGHLEASAPARGSQSELDLVCPFATCGLAVKDGLIGRARGPEVLERRERLWRESIVDDAPDREVRWCPREGCERFAARVGGDRDGAADSRAAALVLTCDCGQRVRPRSFDTCPTRLQARVRGVSSLALALSLSLSLACVVSRAKARETLSLSRRRERRRETAPARSVPLSGGRVSRVV